MFVGEAPGRQEDLSGQPFVGAAGKFLDELLASIGLSREDVYITNVVKSRPVSGPPPGRNRAPAPEEIIACAPWLEEQLRLLRPKVIVTLGRIALDYFLPGRKIADVHGRSIARGRVTLLPLYHPAMALFSQDARSPTCMAAPSRAGASPFSLCTIPPWPYTGETGCGCSGRTSAACGASLTAER